MFIFSLPAVVAELLAINKSCKTYLGPMLPPGRIIWQVIFPDLLQLYIMSVKCVCIKVKDPHLLQQLYVTSVKCLLN